MGTKLLGNLFIFLLGLGAGFAIQHWMSAADVQEIHPRESSIEATQTRTQQSQESVGLSTQQPEKFSDNKSPVDETDQEPGHTPERPQEHNSEMVSNDETNISSASAGQISTRIDEGTRSAQQEFLDWQNQRKQEIAIQLERIEDQELQSFIASKVIDENPLFSTTELRQNPLEDEIWSMQLQQDLSLVLQQHQHVASVQVSIDSIVCKQLVCEVIAQEHSPNTWGEVYFDTIATLLQRGFSIDTMASHNYAFHYETQSFVYHQFVFNRF